MVERRSRPSPWGAGDGLDLKRLSSDEVAEYQWRRFAWNLEHCGCWDSRNQGSQQAFIPRPAEVDIFATTGAEHR